MRHWIRMVLLGTVLLGNGLLRAAEVAVPPALEPWRGWVLDQHQALSCPPHYASLGERFCRWPGRLSLAVTDSGASFAQDWQLYAAGWVTLPGDARYWPQAVRVDERSVPVQEREGRPAVYLPAGEYRITGSFRWTQRPPRLPLAEDTGLVELGIDGQPVALPSIDSEGRLLFGETRRPGDVADSLSVQVFRQLQDDIPVQMETVLRLTVAGRDRELLLGRFLLDGFAPLALDAPLPARLEADGRLRVQVRPGEWELRLRARATGQSMRFAPEPLGEPWPAEEIWSLRDNRLLRQVSASGPASIDPSQTDMPADWRQYPAWLLQGDQALVLQEIQRGEPWLAGGAAGEELTLTRQLWLDFDGHGITSRDSVSGVLQQAARFATPPGQQLGRVDANGEPQLITQLEGAGVGVELRPGPLDLLSVSRITSPGNLTVAGWQRDFSRVSATLHVPPGWMLLHAAGADQAEGSWLARWNLWAIFLVLVTAAGAGRLLGLASGLLALAALLLSFHAPFAPVFLWLAVLVAIALLQALPGGRLRNTVRVATVLVFVALALVILQFAVDQARRSLYPQLELGRDITIHPSSVSTADGGMEPAAAPVQEMAMTAELAGGRMADNEVYKSRPRSMPAPKLHKLKTGYDTQAKVQTGPGEPGWRWQTVQLRWSGPVLQTQVMHLYWLSPMMHRVWNLLSVVLVLLLAGRLARAAFPALGRSGASLPAVLPVLLVLAVAGGHAPSVQAQSFPDAALLTELEQRLTRAPDCEPQCASFQRGLIQLEPDNLRLDLQLDAAVTVAVPLPAARNQWHPRSVLVDGETADSLRTDANGQLWVVLGEGSHRLLLEGPVATDAVNLPFSMPVHNLAVEAKGWQVNGLGPGGQLPGGSLQLQRDTVTAGTDVASQLLPDPAPPFLRVERTLVLGLEWQVQTRVERIAPQTGAITIPVNLLPGEAVLSGGVTVRDGRVQVVLGAGDDAFGWVSRLRQGETLSLQAADGVSWVEQWAFDIAPIWHVQFDGIPPVKQPMTAGQLPRWQPWPGETLVASIRRPEAVAGSTRTVEAAALSVRPGTRAAEASLILDVRSSQGGDLPLTLPAGSQLQRVLVDGVEQAQPADSGALRLPLRPGSQQLAVHWRQDGGIHWREFTPLPVLDEPLTNIELRMELPAGRWLLAVGGPAMGPALLVWGMMLVIVLVAIALGRSRVAPVATWQWVLLGIGMSTVNSAGSILVVLWFIALQGRSRLDTAALSRGRFNLLQCALVLLTVLALGSLVGTIPMSLLSSPDMQVAGNQSTASLLQWYQDRTAGGLPQAWVVSLPIWVYRAAMLVWSLWLVFALLGWCRWGWQAFSAGEWWRSKPVLVTAGSGAEGQG